MKRKQHILFLGFIIAMVAIISLVVVACNLPNNNGSNGEPANKIAEADQQTFAMEAAAAGNMLAQSQGENIEPAPKLAGASGGVEIITPDGGIEVGVDASVDLNQKQRNQIAEQVRGHLRTAEMLVGESAPTIVQEASDRAEFETKVTVTVKDFNGVEAEYVLYLNFVKGDKITAAQVEEFDDPTEDAVENDDDDDDDDDDEATVETLEVYTGIMVLGEGEKAKEYQVVMRKTSETEGTETETKLAIVAKIDNNNYIKIEQKTEVEGTEKEEQFKYTFVENNKVTQRYRLKLEKDENGEIECQIKVEGEKTEQIFKFKKEVEEDNDGAGNGKNAKRRFKLNVEFEDKGVDGKGGFKSKFEIKSEQDSKNNQHRYRFNFEGKGEVCVPRWESFTEASGEYYDFWKNFDSDTYDGGDTEETKEQEADEPKEG
ncbi:MAG TPA: hypothetical protein PKX91_03500 [Clostridia bacterium]|jgi:hypothetical protein|nr:hypothetical protein [Clostridia bacterium]